MTAKDLYEGLLIEINNDSAPNLLLEDFNHYANKTINLFINKRYNIYDINQQTTDDLKTLKSTAILPVKQVNLGENNNFYKGFTSLGDEKLATYEAVLPLDYLHLLNCQCIYNIEKNFKGCYKKDNKFRASATRLTADNYSLVLDNSWNKPTYKKPYYYIHNVNKINTEEEQQFQTYQKQPTNKFSLLWPTLPENETKIVSNKVDWDNLYNTIESFKVKIINNSPVVFCNNKLIIDEVYLGGGEEIEFSIIEATKEKGGKYYTIATDSSKKLITDTISWHYNTNDPSLTKKDVINELELDIIEESNKDYYDSNELPVVLQPNSFYSILNEDYDATVIEKEVISKEYTNYEKNITNGTWSYICRNYSYDTYDFDGNPVKTILPTETFSGKAEEIKGLDPNFTINEDGSISVERLGATIPTLAGDISTVDRVGGIRYGNSVENRIEIRYGTDNSVFRLEFLYIDYIKVPQHICLTQEQLDMTEDTSLILEFPDYVCQEILNELVHIIMERDSNLRLQTHPIVTLSIANPTQALAQQTAVTPTA